MSILDTFDGVYVIAEIGINHNGDLDQAKQLIRAAVQSGANGVKFQVRDLDSIYTEAVLLDPLKAEQGTQYLLDQLKKTLLTFDQIKELHQHSLQYDVDFFATPFDKKSAAFLNSLGIEFFKIGSPDFTNLPLIEFVASFGKPMILSTGMATEDELVAVSQTLKSRKVDFSLLHCSSTYPAAPTDINLRFMARLRELSTRTYGYSGHEIGYAPTLAAVALGARIIERHITFDRMAEGPDHRASLEPAEFREMVDAIREVDLSLGVSEKRISQGELNNRLSLAKSLVAASDLERGHVLIETDFDVRSPAKGVSPLRVGEFLGKTLAAPMLKGEYFSARSVPMGVETSGAESYVIPKTWGIVGRLNDFRNYLDMRPDLVEMHMTWRDIVGYSSFEGVFKQDLVVHAPEYYQDTLIDFVSDDPVITELSLEMLQKTIQIARDLSPHFSGQQDPRGPRVVVHPGGHFPNKRETNKSEQYRILMRNLKAIDSEGVRILVENMPPFPWYFGGQWTNTIFLDPKEISQFAEEMKWGICYDTSHAQLYCSHAGISILDFTKTVLNHVRYLHISDAKGITHEGLQIGEGEINFPALFALLANINPGFIPEIWQGHLDNGKGFRDAMQRIEAMLAKSSGESCNRPEEATSLTAMHDHANLEGVTGRSGARK
jgi:sialic acid synthase SpsE/sugar phosphate isomerase/epimerase